MTSTSGKVPISSHPGFKYAVGLWFAALLGLGLFVMPGAIHDLLVARTGLAALAPFAEPPVGLAARALLAGIAALLGLLFGLVIAQRVALANALDDEDEIYFADETAPVADPVDRPVWLGDALVDQPAHRVFNPREEIDEEGIAGPPPAYPWPEDPEDELVEDEGEDALMQAWREETILPEECLPELGGEEGEIAVFEEVEEGVEPLPAPPGESVYEGPVEPQESGEIEAEAAFDELVPEHEPTPALSPRGEAFGDMSLDALTARLRHALAEAQARDAEASAPPLLPAELDEPDAVIAFLRREAGRHAPGTDAASGFDGDPQSVLRNALDKLSRVSNPK